MLMNARTTRIRWLGNKLISITGRKKLSITFIGVMTHIRKETPSITFIGVMTNIRKEIPSITFTRVTTNTQKNEIPSITFTGVTTNIQKMKYRQLPSLGNDQHTKKEIPSITFTGVTTNIRKEILSITFTGINDQRHLGLSHPTRKVLNWDGILGWKNIPSQINSSGTEFATLFCP